MWFMHLTGSWSDGKRRTNVYHLFCTHIPSRTALGPLPTFAGLIEQICEFSSIIIVSNIIENRHMARLSNLTKVTHPIQGIQTQLL
jgi:hypothetical protein